MRTATRWRDRRELRALFYFLPAYALIEGGVSIVKAFDLSHHAPSPFRPTFWTALDLDWITTLAIGIGAIAYDRYRLKMDLKENNECPTCGYDLRVQPRPVRAQRVERASDAGPLPRMRHERQAAQSDVENPNHQGHQKRQEDNSKSISLALLASLANLAQKPLRSSRLCGASKKGEESGQ